MREGTCETPDRFVAIVPAELRHDGWLDVARLLLLSDKAGSAHAPDVLHDSIRAGRSLSGRPLSVDPDTDRSLEAFSLPPVLELQNCAPADALLVVNVRIDQPATRNRSLHRRPQQSHVGGGGHSVGSQDRSPSEHVVEAHRHGMAGEDGVQVA
jgi:hypothetical protein